MSRLFLCLLLCLLLFLPGPLASAEQIVVPIGRSVYHPLGGSGASVRVSSGRILRVTPRGSMYSLFGKSKGHATVIQGNRTWSIAVTSGPSSKLYQDFSNLIKSMRGLSLHFEDDRVVVRGTLLRLKDWVDFAKAQDQVGGNWMMRAEIDRNLLAEIPQFLNEQNIPSSLRFITSPIPYLEASQTTHQLLKDDSHFQRLGLEVKSLPNDLGDQPLLKIQLDLTELQNTAGARLGLEYEDGQALQLLPKLDPPTTFSATLRHLANQGEARILASPTLTVKSGSQAEYLAGGEIALRGRKGSHSEIQWKRYGLILNFLPQIRVDGDVDLKIESEFSNPDFSQVIDGIPSLRSTHTKTSIRLPLDRTLLVSGLLRDQSGSSQEGLQALKDIPILGHLFRSDNYFKQKSDLRLFIRVTKINLQEAD